MRPERARRPFQYPHPRRFKQFAISDGVLQWNDFDLAFPMADLYDGVIR